MLVLSGLLLGGCATVRLGSIPQSSETAKLRMAVIPISGHVSRGGWGLSDEKFAENQLRGTQLMLEQLGYYEVVPDAELRAVLAGYEPDMWRMTRRDAELSRRVGRALYADYVMLVERGTAVGGDPRYFFELILINVESGRQIGVRLDNDRRQTRFRLPPGMPKIAYRQLFKDARSDLLVTALRKIRGGVRPEPEQERQSAEAARLRDEQQAEQARQEQARLARLKAEEEQLAEVGLVATGSRVIDYLTAEQAEERQLPGAKRLIVYDLAVASDSYRPVALILSEALREEIHRRGSYNLVNRENLQQLLDEMKFQQSGLVESEQAVQLGKGAGAQEIVTGNLGALGRSVVLQSKRTDIQSMLNLSLASLRSEVGQEDLLLVRLSEMVDQLLKQGK